MRLTQLYDLLFAICNQDAEHIIALFPFINWCYENNFYSILYNQGKVQVLFYGFTTERKAKEVEQSQSWQKFAECLLDRNKSGDVMVVVFAGGNIDKYGYMVFKKLLKELKIKGILFYKRKTNRYFYLEV